ncbi:MAG TPA: FAD-dependent oxidoreductase [Solirubrobacterales bacterium]|nr:FAD-dependent oxidoreductase [Solirubrobacterales bacterium]
MRTSETYPWPAAPPGPRHRAAFADAVVRPFWTDRLPRREPFPPLDGTADADLCIVGGGFTGLWAALHAKAEDPDREIVVLEGTSIAAGASGRNGGFAIASLTHGIENGMARFADEMPVLERLARENFAGLLADLRAHRIDCDLELTGDLTVALEPHEEAWLAESAELHRRFGHEVDLLGGEEMRAEIASPLYRAGLWDKTDAAILDPAKLAEGLAHAATGLGVRIHERSHVENLIGTSGSSVVVKVEGPPTSGEVRARRVLLATSAYLPLVRSIRRYVAPVYDYVLVTEPLDRARRESLGWHRRQGVGDAANQFHYYRLTDDDRVLWGGYDAVYRFGGPVADRLDDDERAFAGLSQRFFTTFPQLEGVRFTHRWGGAIDTCSRFSVFFGTAHGGRVAYAAGYTGLGVAASRFGARVALDLLAGRETEATQLRYVRRRPVPFPPEPLRSGVIQLTRNRLAAADRNRGRRGLWLRTLDRLGLGFDS